MIFEPRLKSRQHTCVSNKIRPSWQGCSTAEQQNGLCCFLWPQQLGGNGEDRASVYDGRREGGRGGQEGQRVGGKPSQIVDDPVAQIRDDLLFHIHFLINFITKKKKRGLSVKF